MVTIKPVATWIVMFLIITVLYMQALPVPEALRLFVAGSGSQQEDGKARSGYQYGSISLDSSKCPEWMHHYTQFHVQNKGKAGAKYLVHRVEGTSGGLGDRFNGALSTLRLAHTLNRVLLLSWAKPQPFDIEDFFVPAGPLNWSMKGIPYQRGKVFNFVDSWKNRAELLDGSLQHLQDDFVTLVTNMEINATCKNCPPVASQWSEEAACLWQSMFRPVDAVLDQAQAELARLYPNGPSPYVAVHLRLGGLTGEEGIPGAERGMAPLPNFIAAARCAAGLAASHHINLTHAPMLVITDNHRLRQGLQENILGNVVSPGGLPVHLDRAEGQSLEAHRKTFVDLVLLGWGECLVTSNSGYSLHAWLYGGGKPCRAPFKACL